MSAKEMNPTCHNGYGTERLLTDSHVTGNEATSTTRSSSMSSPIPAIITPQSAPSAGPSILSSPFGSSESPDARRGPPLTFRFRGVPSNMPYAWASTDSAPQNLDQNKTPSPKPLSSLPAPRIYQLSNLQSNGQNSRDAAQSLSREHGQESGSILPELQGSEFTFRCFHNSSPQPPRLFPLPDERREQTSGVEREVVAGTSQAGRILHRGDVEDKIAVTRQESPRRHLPVSSSEPTLSVSARITSPLATDSTAPEMGGQYELDSLHVPRPRAVSESSVLSESEVLSPYDATEESGPGQPFYSTAFQAALKESMAVAQDSSDLLNSSPFTDQSSVLHRLKGDALHLSSFQSTDTRTIAVLGDSGEGKSSLINSLLHYPELARTGDIGSACTSVVTEYRQKSDTHVATITIEVMHLSPPEIKDLVSELVWNYYKLYLPGVESDTTSAQEYQRYERASEVAWSSLEAAFKHRREFNRNLFRDTSEEGIKRTISKLTRWTENLQWPAGDEDENGNGLWKSTAETAQECRKKTAAFMKDRLWPFTKLIRIFVSSQILKAGIVLADLPGLQDTNFARVRATQEYLLQCDHIFIVTNIFRAITNKSVKDSLYHVLTKHVPVDLDGSAGSAGRYLNVAVVCTHSEVIDESNARMEFCGPSKYIKPSELATIDRDIQTANDKGDRRLKKRLRERRRFIFVAARNDHVKKGLRRAYASKVPGGCLSVYCVSNNIYQKYTRKGDMEMIQDSGIPDLRRFCYVITATAQLSEAKHYIHSKLGSLLNSMQIWVHACQPNTSSQAPEVLETLSGRLEDVERKTITEFRYVANRFMQTFSEQLLRFADKRVDAWEKAGEREAEAWLDWHWTQYNAWCRNYGDWSTPKRSHVNWNKDLVWKMKAELALQWDILDDEFCDLLKALCITIKLQLSDFKSTVNASGALAELESGIDLRIQSIEYIITRVQQDFLHSFRTIRRRMTEGNAESYIRNEMIPSYRTASQQSGTGKKSRQHAAVHGHITSGAIFPNIAFAAQRDMQALVDSTMKDLEDQILAGIQAIRNDLSLADTNHVRSQLDVMIHEVRWMTMTVHFNKIRERYDKVLEDVKSVDGEGKGSVEEHEQEEEVGEDNSEENDQDDLSDDDVHNGDDVDDVDSDDDDDDDD